MNNKAGPLAPEVEAFRRTLRVRVCGDRFLYIDADRIVGTCPICGADLFIEFHGRAARATLICHLGCSEASLAAVLRMQATS